MTPSYRTSVKGTLLSTGEDTRNRILAALPGSAASLAKDLNISKSLVRYTFAKLLALKVITLSHKVVVGKNTEHVYKAVSLRVPETRAKKVLQTPKDPQKPPLDALTPQMRDFAMERPSTRNLWTQPVWTPPKWEPPRGNFPHIPSRG